MRRALVVGIDEYPDPYLRLGGCVQDADRMRSVLANHHDGAPNFDCRVIRVPTDTLTRGELREAVRELFDQPADVAWLHFSGHGVASDLGGHLVTPDAAEHEFGVPMAEVLALANKSQVSERMITLDCCYSGAIGQVHPIIADHTTLAEGVSVVTATRAAQASLEVGGGGVFTSLLADAVEGGAAGVLGEITAAGVYAYIDNALGAWDQRPLFKSNVSRFVRLRNSRPKVELDILRRIVDHFPLPAEDRNLDPSYRPMPARVTAMLLLFCVERACTRRIYRVGAANVTRSPRRR